MDRSKFYCNICQTVHIRQDAFNLVCDKCGHRICDCSSCQAIMKMVQEGKLDTSNHLAYEGS